MHVVLFLPSSHEGLPIALLEAMSYKLPVIVSNIPANMEVGLPYPCYFKIGDVGQLQKKTGKADGTRSVSDRVRYEFI